MVDYLNWHDVIDVILKTNTIYILPHVDADGDALGSSLALAVALTKLNKNASVILEENVQETYNFLPYIDKVKVFLGENIGDNSLVIALDTGDIERLGARSAIFAAAAKTINIDHHSTNTQFAQQNIVDSHASATAELIYFLLKEMHIDIDHDIALCLYVAISTDTGNFKYSNTTSTTHAIVSELLSQDLDIANVLKKLYDTVSLEKVILIGKVINTIELEECKKIATMVISSTMIQESGAKKEDYDGIVNIGRNIKGVEVSVLFTELDSGNIKVNLRSNDYVDVSKIASEFSGGGHQRAAGCTIKGDLQNVKIKVINRVRRELQCS